MMDFYQLLEGTRREVNSKIDEILSTSFERSDVRELLRYAFRTGGKRLRPILLVLACEAVGGSEASALNAAVAVEFIHTASLIFDDMIDKDRLRRDSPSVHAAFYGDKAISAGLFLASKGLRLLSDYDDPKIMGMIGWTLVDLSKGEILDVVTDFSVNIDNYLTIAELKTGSLFGASAGIGGIIGNGTRPEIDALYGYGRSLGIAFQIRDDIIDAYDQSIPSRARMGRTNVTLVQFPYERSKMGWTAQIHRKTTQRGGDINAKRKKALKFAVKMAKEHVDRAKAQLRILRREDAKKILERFADFALERSP